MERVDENLISRPPTQADLANLCRELNLRGAKYVVVGALAIIAAGHARMTTDVDLLRSAGGIDYAEAAKDMVVREADPVRLAAIALAHESGDASRKG